MALIGFNGGLIGSQRSAAIGAAYGLWTANEQVVLKRAGLWTVVSDTDAAAYIAAVEAADGQPLEDGVKAVINSFVLGCKADGIWTAIKASCILAGARTLSGALVPLVGAAPTNFNFVSGDYNRETGLVGNGSTKYLNSNRNNNADPQNSHHYSIYCSQLPSINDFPVALASTPYGTTGATQLYRRRSAGNRWEGQNRNSTAQTSTSLTGTTATFVGMARTSSTNVNIRANQVTGNNAITSQSPGSESTIVFGASAASANFNGRLAFYSIGESLDLALLDTRVTTLIDAIAAAIP
jgi:hypothetical protein